MESSWTGQVNISPNNLTACSKMTLNLFFEAVGRFRQKGKGEIRDVVFGVNEEET